MNPTVSLMITSCSRGSRKRREVGSRVANIRASATTSLAVSAFSLMALKPVIDAYPNVWEFVREWNATPEKMKLLKPDMREYFKAHKVSPFYDEVRNYNIDDVIAQQKEMCAAVRKEYASLT